VAVIVTAGPQPTRAVKEATASIPDCLRHCRGDPVRLGFVKSLARPGGNITGFQSFVPGGFGGKQLELLKEAAVPHIVRVAVLLVPQKPLHRPVLEETGPAAEALKLNLQVVEARAADDLERAFEAAVRDRADAMQVYGHAIMFVHRARVADLALKHRLPTLFLFKPNVEAGGLLSYGPDEPDILRRAATSVDKIFKGANPGDLPVERPTKFELVINLKTS
jgi:putative ABC transport system substrate-binding protein